MHACLQIAQILASNSYTFCDAAGYSTAFIDPYAALRSKKPLPTDPEGSEDRPFLLYDRLRK